MEEEYIEKMCAEIVAFHPDIVITEKGVSGALLPCVDGRKEGRRPLLSYT